ncbi:MAG: hypothetical protein ACI9EW_001637 [Cellvibrionaceae bacterium]|jgi:hypothetical protein
MKSPLPNHKETIQGTVLGQRSGILQAVQAIGKLEGVTKAKKHLSLRKIEFHLRKFMISSWVTL